MAARLVFLGRLADVAGVPDMAVEPGPLETVLASLAPELAVELLGERVRMALNGQVIADRGHIMLTHGDEIAFLPPVSGG